MQINFAVFSFLTNLLLSICYKENYLLASDLPDRPFSQSKYLFEHGKFFHLHVYVAPRVLTTILQNTYGRFLQFSPYVFYVLLIKNLWKHINI